MNAPRTPPAVAASTADAPATVLAYHERTKHRLDGYARGPETLDWEAQPDPFRRYAGAPLEPLPLTADTVATPWSRLFVPGAVAPRSFSRTSLGLLLELAFALAAWKQHGPDRWAVRCNPSSGNLHPTEVYVLSRGTTALVDALYHYAPREHALEKRCDLPDLRSDDTPDDRAHVFVGLASIHWREAWKYGERAFRYCQLDAGHAIGALRYAAAVLGWHVRPASIGAAALGALLGLDREADFADAEREDPDLLFELVADALDTAPLDPSDWTRGAHWQGRANRLDRHPLYRWPIIDEVARASAPRGGEAHAVPDDALPASQDDAAASPPALSLPPSSDPRATTLIRNRRSAQHFDRRARVDRERFLRIACALLPGARRLPWDAWPHPPRVHAVFFAHRVDGITPGAYLLPRDPHAFAALRAALPAELEWAVPPDLPAGLPLYELADNPALAGTLRTICCHQALGADAMFVVALLAEFAAPIAAAPANYRALLQECGLMGQVLYLEAEAAGLRGTGIGCFFDDASHQLLGLRDRQFQVLYHFTVGLPLADPRIASEPPYPEIRHVP